MIGLIPAALVEHRAFTPYRHQAALVARMLTAGFRQNALTDASAPLPRFVPPPARAVSAIDFERRVVEHNELIVRPDNLHDIMNAIVWCTFPRTKRAISETHVALGVTPDGKTRPRRRDVLTLFDEAGIIILSQRDDLKRLHEAHEWARLFVDHRQDFVLEANPILFGHGALEQLVSNPHRGLTVKALWLPLAPGSPLAAADTWLADAVSTGALLTESEHRLPLPLLGLPGWFAENLDSACYSDTDVFRPLRSGSKPFKSKHSDESGTTSS